MYYYGDLRTAQEKAVDKYRVNQEYKYLTGQEKRPVLSKKEQRKELLITLPLYIIGIPLLFVLPWLVLVAAFGV